MMKLTVIKKSYTNIIVVALLLVVLGAMTVGFAFYRQTLNIGGSAIVVGNGNIYISNVTVGTLRNATTTPTYDASSIDFNLYFDSTNATNNTDYSATYTITVTNDSVYDYAWVMPGYTPTVYGMNMEKYYDTSQIRYTVSGISAGDTIPSKGSATYTVTFTFTAPDVNETQYEIDGDYHQVTSNIDTGSLLASAIVSSGDLTGSNTICAYQVEVINTYKTAKTFTLSAVDSSKFVVTDASGVSPLTFTVPANTSDTYTFYLQKANSAQYGTETQRVDLVFNDGTTSASANYVIALVDQNIFYPDEIAPYISNVSATILNTVGSVSVSWQGRDNVAIDHYSVIVFNSSNTEVKRQSTSDASTTLTITGLSDTNYYFTVIGYDTATPTANTASASDIRDATTNEGHACRTNEEFYDWHFSVSYTLGTGVTSSGSNNDVVNRGSTYSTSFTLRNNYSIDSLTVKMGGRTLNSSEYNQNGTNLSVPNVLGNLEINVTTTQGGGGDVCLAFGTKVLMADGTYRKIEEITYDDLVCVYDHVNGKFTSVYPLWIEIPSYTNSFDRITFSDGSFLDIVGNHSLYDVDLRNYVNVQDKNVFHVGSRIYKVKNQQLEVVGVEKIERIEQDVGYTCIVTPKVYNLVAGDVITINTYCSMSNFYGFKDNAIYSENYKKVCESEKFSYEDFKEYFAQYLFHGLDLQNLKAFFGEEIPYEFLSSFILHNTISPKMVDGKYRFIATIQLKDSMEKQEVFEGEKVKMPDSGASYYIETSTGTKYAPGEQAVIDYNMHFIAVYEE